MAMIWLAEGPWREDMPGNGENCRNWREDMENNGHCVDQSTQPPPDTVVQAASTLLGWVMWLVCAAAIAKLCWIGAEMALSEGQRTERPTWVLAGLCFASAASGIAGALLV